MDRWKLAKKLRHVAKQLEEVEVPHPMDVSLVVELHCFEQVILRHPVVVSWRGDPVVQEVEVPLPGTVETVRLRVRACVQAARATST